ncbi:MAG: hypothetical protein JO072_12575 [Parafilimonas sp.]|nr:hypothetical protein [Parafilimonas sp.]
MKKFFVILLFTSAFFTLSASAQKGKMGASKQILMDSLKVSESVADSIISIRSQSMSQIKTIMSDQSLSQDQKKEKTKPVKQEMKTRLKSLLTDDQIQKLQEMEMNMRQKSGQ